MNYLIWLLIPLLLFSCAKAKKADFKTDQIEEAIKDIEVKGTINTVTPAFDVGVVNMWEDKDTREKVVGVCYNGEEVTILEITDDMLKVKNKSGVSGWIMEVFVKYQKPE